MCVCVCVGGILAVLVIINVCELAGGSTSYGTKEQAKNILMQFVCVRERLCQSVSLSVCLSVFLCEDVYVGMYLNTLICI